MVSSTNSFASSTGDVTQSARCPIAALIFDFDGLILDTEWPEFSTVRDEFAGHGVALELEDWQQIIGRADHPHWFDWLQSEVDEPSGSRRGRSNADGVRVTTG